MTEMSHVFESDDPIGNGESVPDMTTAAPPSTRLLFPLGLFSA